MQSNRNRQRLDSSRVAALGLLGIVVLVFIMAISNLLTSCNSSISDEKMETHGPPHNYWVPTAEDILYQDSMYVIIKQTESNMDTINEGMDRIIQKLDIIIYNDGSSDSVKLYEDEHVANYNSFNDVPAGCDSIIRVAGITYKKSIDNWIAL